MPNRAIASRLPAHRKAEDGNDAHVAAPLPGSVAALAVKPGAVVKAGDILMTIEAMKMETALHSPRAGVIKEVLVHPGSPVEAEDLLTIDWMLPGIPPTGKAVGIPMVAVVHFRGDKLVHEHIYWDQASVLVQIGKLDSAGLPVAGAETARKVVDNTQPSNELLAAAWATSEGKPI